MANEVTAALLNTNGGRTAEIMLASMIRKRLYDPTSLRQFIDYIPYAPGSLVNALTLDAVPGAAAAASSETSGGASNSAYTTSKVQFTIARYLKFYQESDLFQVTAGPGMIDANHVVGVLMEALDLTLTDLIAALFPSIATNVGTTTVDLSVDNIYSAMYALILAKVEVGPGNPATCVLGLQQRVDFLESLRNEPGAMQFQQSTADMLSLKGTGPFGTWNNVQFVGCDSVATANATADVVGCMFGKGCFGYQLAPCQTLSGTQVGTSDVLVNMPEMLVERQRDGSNGLTKYILQFFPSVAEIEDLRGCAITTDA